MAFIIYKTKKGREYAYWARWARVNGKPRIVEQVNLGPRDRFLEETRAAYTRGQATGPTPLKRIRTLTFGASSSLWSWADRLGLVEIVQWYNHDRLQSGMGCVTPAAMHFGEADRIQKERRTKLAATRHRRKEENLKLRQRSLALAAHLETRSPQAAATLRLSQSV